MYTKGENKTDTLKSKEPLKKPVKKPLKQSLKQPLKQPLKPVQKQKVEPPGNAASERLANVKVMPAKRLTKWQHKIANSEGTCGGIRKFGSGHKKKSTGACIPKVKASKAKKPKAAGQPLKKTVKPKARKLGVNRLRGGTVKKAAPAPKLNEVVVRLNKAALQRFAANAYAHATVRCDEKAIRKTFRPAQNRSVGPTAAAMTNPSLIRPTVQELKFKQMPVKLETLVEETPLQEAEVAAAPPEQPKRKPFPKMKHTLMSKARYEQAAARLQREKTIKTEKCLLPMTSSYKDFIHPETRLLAQFKHALATCKHPERLIPEEGSPLYMLLESFEGSLEKRKERIDELNKTLPANMKIIDYTKNFF